MFLGIDLGTTRIKAMVMDKEGKIRSSISKSFYQTFSSDSSFAEQNPEEWWRAVKDIVKSLVNVEEVEINLEDVECVSLSGQMHGAVAVDIDGNPLRPALLWCDTRAEEEANILRKKVDNLLEITGNPSVPEFQAPKIMWIKNNEKRIFENTHKFLFPKDYINFKLTGNFFTDFTDASGSLLFDISEGSWSGKILDKLSIPRDKLPEISKSTSKVGGVSERASKETGLPFGVPVMAGAGDLASSVIGSGLNDSGETAIDIGTAGRIMTVVDFFNEEFLDNFFVFSHPDPNFSFLMRTIPSGGNSLEWFRKIIGNEKEISLDTLEEKASSVPIGSNGVLFLPYLLGSEEIGRGNKSLKGAFFGLKNGHGKGELSRSIMEGVSFSLRYSFDQFREDLGDISKIKFVGGASKSDLWKRIVSNVFDRKLVSLSVSDSSLLGACMISAVGGGYFSDFSEACEMVSVENQFVPDEKTVSNYEEVYRKFKSARDLLKNF